MMKTAMGPPSSPARLDIDTGSLGDNDTLEERLIVRVDQPIENVNFAAHTLLRGGDGGVLTPSSRKIKYRWFRSRTRRNCSYEGCQTQRQVASMQSLVTGERYCSPACFLADHVHKDKFGSKNRALQQDMLDSGKAKNEYGWDVKPFEEDEGWDEISDTKSYVPTAEDVGHLLKVECSAVAPDGRVSVTCESSPTNVVIGVSKSHQQRLLNRGTISSELLKKKYAHSGVKGLLQNEGGGAMLRVITYNILAEVYATKQLYPYCPLWALSWGYRRQLILQELLERSGDIICLQEMQADHFEEFLLPELQKVGYDGLFKSKTRESMGRKGKIDGCAIIYRKDRLTLIDYKNVEYNTMAVNVAQARGFHLSELSHQDNERRTQRILKRLMRDNVGIVAIFETNPQGFADDPVLHAAAEKTGPQQLCVTTTHIFWDPEYSDVKFWQTQALMQELGHICGGQDMPLIFCGDLNSTPDSIVVQYLNSSHDPVNPGHPDLQNDPLDILPDASMMHHGLELTSAYAYINGGKEPECTNYTAHYSGVLDYIFISTNNITPLATLEIPPEKARRGEDDTYMPNVNFPSDHISLIVDVNINPPQRIRSCPSTPTPPSPSMTPPQQMMSSPGHEHLHQYRLQQQHLHRGGIGSSLKQNMHVHSPNPAMVYMHQHHHYDSSLLNDRGSSPGLHPGYAGQQQQQQQQNSFHSPSPRMF